MSSFSLVNPDVLYLLICIILHDSVSCSLLPVRFSRVRFSVVCKSRFTPPLLKSCLLLEFRDSSGLRTAWSASLLLVLGSVAISWVPWQNCWISFNRTDWTFLCGFLCLGRNAFCDLLCLRWCFEVLAPEPRRRQLQMDVFMHSSFFGKLQGTERKTEHLLKCRKTPSIMFDTCSFYQLRREKYKIPESMKRKWKFNSNLFSHHNFPVSQVAGKCVNFAFKVNYNCLAR